MARQYNQNGIVKEDHTLEGVVEEVLQQGQVGSILHLKPVLGKSYRVYLLLTDSDPQDGITITTNKGVLFDNKTLISKTDITNDVENGTGVLRNYVANNNMNTMLTHIDCKSFTIESTAPTTQAISIHYEVWGE